MPAQFNVILTSNLRLNFIFRRGGWSGTETKFNKGKIRIMCSEAFQNRPFTEMDSTGPFADAINVLNFKDTEMML